MERGQKIKLICVNCKKEFYVLPCRIRQGKRFCSKNCYSQFQTGVDVFALLGIPKAKKPCNRVSMECEWCGQTFQTVPSKKYGGRKYCSRDCYKEACRLLDISNPRDSADYRKWRLKILQRDEFHCAACKETKDLEVHHIKPVALYPELIMTDSNAITLCESCHTEVHSQMGKLIRKRDEFSGQLSLFQRVYTEPSLYSKQ